LEEQATLSREVKVTGDTSLLAEWVNKMKKAHSSKTGDIPSSSEGMIQYRWSQYNDNLHVLLGATDDGEASHHQQR
jgi:hypothetical protein